MPTVEGLLIAPFYICFLNATCEATIKMIVDNSMYKQHGKAIFISSRKFSFITKDDLAPYTLHRL